MYLIIMNPKAGSKERKKLLKQAQDYLDEQEIQHTVVLTTHKGHAMEFVQQQFPTACTDILVIGGDGTLNEVVNGLQKSGKAIPLGILPTGTGNDYVKSIPFPKKVKEQLRVAVHGQCLQVDVGKCNERYFINTMGFGFDGQVVAIMEKQGKQFGGHLAYLYTVLKTVTGFKEPQVNFQIDGTDRQESLFLMAINHGTTYGGGFKITPNAIVDDGFFDVCFIKKITKLRRYLNLPKLQSGTHTSIKEVEMIRCKTLKVAYALRVEAHVDGEYIGPPPYEVSLLPKVQAIRIEE